MVHVPYSPLLGVFTRANLIGFGKFSLQQISMSTCKSLPILAISPHTLSLSAPLYHLFSPISIPIHSQNLSYFTIPVRFICPPDHSFKFSRSVRCSMIILMYTIIFSENKNTLTSSVSTCIFLISFSYLIVLDIP